MTEVLCIGEPLLELRANGTEVDVGLGGDMLNVAARLVAQGAPAGLLYVRSRDALGDWMATRIEELGVAAAPRVSDGNTGIYSISIDADGERTFSYWREEGAASRLEDDDIDLDGYSAVVISGITQALSDSARSAVHTAVTRSDNQLVVYDPNVRTMLWDRHGGRHAAREAAEDVLPHVDIFVPSIEDCALLWGVTEADEVPRHIPWFEGKVIITSGSSGAWVFDKGRGTYVAPTINRRVIDTTGAGDAFTATLLARLLDSDDFLAAAQHAVDDAAETVVFAGALTDLHSQRRLSDEPTVARAVPSSVLYPE